MEPHGIRATTTNGNLCRCLIVQHASGQPNGGESTGQTPCHPACLCLVTVSPSTFASGHSAHLSATMPLPTYAPGAKADIRGTLVAVHFRDERGFAIFSIEQDAGSGVRALGYLPPDIALRAVVRAGGTWTQHARYGWQLQVRTLELIDHQDQRGIVAFLVAYTTHLGPVRAADAVARFGSRIFQVIREHPQDPCVIKGITPERARAVHDSFATVASIANVDAWLRHIGLGKADARRVRDAYGEDVVKLVRENPYRLADEVHGIGFIAADSLRVMLGIGPTSTFRLHAALNYVLALVARTEGHVFL